MITLKYTHIQYLSHPITSILLFSSRTCEISTARPRPAFILWRQRPLKSHTCRRQNKWHSSQHHHTQIPTEKTPQHVTFMFLRTFSRTSYCYTNCIWDSVLSAFTYPTFSCLEKKEATEIGAAIFIFERIAYFVFPRREDVFKWQYFLAANYQTIKLLSYCTSIKHVCPCAPFCMMMQSGSVFWHFTNTDWPNGNAVIKRSKFQILNGPNCYTTGSVLMKIGEMMHLVTDWPKGCLLLLLRMTCVAVSNGTVTVYLTQLAHGCILTRAHGIRDLMWLIILIVISIIIIII